MIRTDEGYYKLSTGQVLYITELHFGEDSTGLNLYQGLSFTEEERYEIRDYMLDQWNRWANGTMKKLEIRRRTKK